MFSEQRIRAILYYLSVGIFLVGLPFILAFALGYRFDSRTFKFTRAGLISVKTEPPGASIYLDGKMLDDKTPASLNELLPGRYNIKLELKGYYPWANDVNVEAGRVTRLEKVIFFAQRPNVRQLNKEKAHQFWVDEEKEKIYYLNQEENIIYRSNLDGGDFAQLTTLPENIATLKKWKISPDKEKLLIISPHQLAVIYIGTQDNQGLGQAPLILDFPERKIIDAFWHSDSFHLVMVTEKNIEVLEASFNPGPINLVNFNKKSAGAGVFYDTRQDALYFVDSQKAADGKFYDNVYKLSLSTKLYPFQELIKQKKDEQR